MTRRTILGVLGLALVVIASSGAAEPGEAGVIAAVTAADDERVAALVSRDLARLEAVLSDDLRYAHSNGTIDSKASLIEANLAGRAVYRKIDYPERTFTAIAPGVVLMSGRILVDARSGERPVALDLNFLAVWRLEQGVWRFVAWQSSRNPPPAPQ